MKSFEFTKLNELKKWGRDPTEEELRNLEDSGPGYFCSTRVRPGQVVLTQPPTIACDDAGNPIMPPPSTAVPMPSPAMDDDWQPTPGFMPDWKKFPQLPRHEPDEYWKRGPTLPRHEPDEDWKKRPRLPRHEPDMENPIHLYKKLDPRFKGMEIPKYKHKDHDPRLKGLYNQLEKINQLKKGDRDSRPKLDKGVSISAHGERKALRSESLEETSRAQLLNPVRPNWKPESVTDRKGWEQWKAEKKALDQDWADPTVDPGIRRAATTGSQYMKDRSTGRDIPNISSRKQEVERKQWIKPKQAKPKQWAKESTELTKLQELAGLPVTEDSSASSVIRDWIERNNASGDGDQILYALVKHLESSDPSITDKVIEFIENSEGMDE